jgi:hypothetical protein
MILNYRVELCRQCYFKRTKQCSFSDLYIQRAHFHLVKQNGECSKYKPTPWLPT